MKTIIPLLAIVGAVSGTWMERRQASVINSAFSDITSKTSALDSAVLAYTPGGDTSSIVSASTALLSAIKTGDANIKGAAPLTVEEGTQIAEGGLALNETASKLIDDLIAKKDVLAAANQASAIHEVLVAQKSAADGLAATIVGKTPTALKEIAKQLSEGIGASIQRGVDVYATAGSGTAPTSTSGSSGSSSGSAVTAPEDDCGEAPVPAAAKPAIAAPATPSQYTAPLAAAVPKPAKASTTGASPAVFTGAASRMDASSMFALGVAAVALVL